MLFPSFFKLICITLKNDCFTDRNIGYLYLYLYTYLVSRLLCGVGSSSLLSHTSTPVSRFRFIDLNPAAVVVPVAFVFYILNNMSLLLKYDILFWDCILMGKQGTVDG